MSLISNLCITMQAVFSKNYADLPWDAREIYVYGIQTPQHALKMKISVIS